MVRPNNFRQSSRTEAVHLQHALEESGPQPYQNRQMSNLPNRDLPKEEWRYTLVSSGGSMPIFEETNRKVFRALGFAWEGSKSSNLGRIRLEAQSPVDPRDPEEAAESPDNGSAEASIAAAAPAPAAGSSAGESGRDVRSRLSYLLKPKGAPVRSPPAVPPPTKAEPSETTAAPSEVKPEPLKEPPKPPLDAEAAEAKNLRTGDTSDTSDTNGIKSLDSPEVSASPVETTEGSQQSSTVPEAPEAPRSVAREANNFAQDASVQRACGWQRKVAADISDFLDVALEEGSLSLSELRCKHLLKPLEAIDGEREGRDRGAFRLLKAVSILLRLHGFQRGEPPFRELVIYGQPLLGRKEHPSPARALEQAVHICRSSAQLKCVQLINCHLDSSEACVAEVIRLVCLGNVSLQVCA
ncbi:unnamed protein product [Cladocopium goreaui]|uniref:Uncharacterized protein n=1 Tax=Cladocopium goreaui TaxID=2562237 RepID=A0A9P1CG44_9DINO|nr:unnamed protein product [Cladocopium goreaui]